MTLQNEQLNEEAYIKEPSERKIDDSPNAKKKSKIKFLIYFLIIIVLTAAALFISLRNDYGSVIQALKHSDWRYILLIFGLVALFYFIEAFTIFAFSRLYTRKYKYHQGLAAVMVDAFYANITPGASGGQIMEAYTMKKQGVEVSTAASIMVMSFITYQICLIVLGAVGLFFSNGLLSSIATFDININGTVIPVPTIVFTIAGFALNVFVILILFLMSYSHGFHNFIMHRGINLLHKLRLIKNPEEKRESLRIQVENFKIELKRLLSNVPLFTLMLICFTLMLIIKFSIPFFAGLALDGYGYCINSDGSLAVKAVLDERGIFTGVIPIISTGQADIQSFWQAVFLSSYHQMATGLVPIPGTAGISEYFFQTIFNKYYTSTHITTAAQIIWRFSTYHSVLFVSGIVSATYRSSPKSEIHHANRKTFITLQLQTYDERKLSAEKMYETASLSRKAIQSKLRKLAASEKKKEPKVKKEKIKRNKHIEDEWSEFDPDNL